MRIFGFVVAFIAIITLFLSLYIVDQRQYALVLQFGEPVALRDQPGLKMKVPYIQNVIFFDNRIQNLTANTKEVIAQDQKTMRVDAFLKYRISDALKFYQTVQDEQSFKKRLDSILESSLRQVLGGVPFKAVLSPERGKLMNQISTIVDGQAKSFGVDVLDVRIMRADLPDASKTAVEKRMRAEREKEAREIRAGGSEEAKKIRAIADKDKRIILANARKQAEITKGEGDALAIEIFSKAFNKNPEFYEFYRSLEAYRNSINPETDTIIFSTENSFMKYFRDYNN